MKYEPAKRCVSLGWEYIQHLGCEGVEETLERRLLETSEKEMEESYENDQQDATV
jgi:hypothetical protein